MEFASGQSFQSKPERNVPIMKPMPAPMKTKMIGKKIVQNLAVVSRVREDFDRDGGFSGREIYCRRIGSPGKEPLIPVIQMQRFRYPWEVLSASLFVLVIAVILAPMSETWLDSPMRSNRERYNGNI